MTERLARAAVFTVLVCIMTAFFTVYTFADETINDSIMDGLYDAAEKATDGSEEEISEGYSGSIEDLGSFTVDILSPQEAITRLFGFTATALPSALRLLTVLLGLVALSAVCNSLCDSVGGATEGFGFLSTAVITSAIVGSQMELIFDVESFFERLGALMASMIPITGSVWAMGGNVSTATVGTVTLGVMLGFVERFCAVTVVPICCVCLTAAISSGLSDSGLLEGFSSGVKKVYGFFVGMVMTVFVFCLGTQTTITSAADTVTARGAKTLASTLIPGIGGAVGDTLRTVAGSVGYIKSVVGVGGIILLAVLTLPVLMGLLLARGALLIASTAADMLGCKREHKLLVEMSNVYGLLIGAVSVCAIAFAVALGLFVKCTVAAE